MPPACDDTYRFLSMIIGKNITNCVRVITAKGLKFHELFIYNTKEAKEMLKNSCVLFPKPNQNIKNLFLSNLTSTGNLRILHYFRFVAARDFFR